MRDGIRVYAHAKRGDTLLGFIQRVMAKRRAKGLPVGTITTSDTPLEAYVNEDRLLVDCPCRAGNPVDRAEGKAYCCECWRIHTNIVIPDELDEAVAVLDARPDIHTRNWAPGRESIAFLRDENRRHGVRD